MREVDLRWYETFFEGVAVELWRRAVSPDQTQADVVFLQKHLGLARGQRVLDVPCGLGRHAVELAALGCNMSAVDLSEESLKEGRATAAERGVQVDWRHLDMRELPWNGEFDAAYCFGNSFGYLEPDGTVRFVKAVARALQPGGLFALQTGIAAESVLPNLRARDESQVGDILFIEENRYDAWESRVETSYTFVRRGERETRPALHWVYTVRELRELLGRHGLEVTAALGADGAPFQAGSYELYLLARKQ